MENLNKKDLEKVQGGYYEPSESEWAYVDDFFQKNNYSESNKTIILKRAREWAETSDDFFKILSLECGGFEIPT